ncbi:MAG: hypothetical protein A3G24_03830 [Betaproteobacteria bacterium RIFCSPLOWO2_12_FULL_62_13]|nr:MAG: hypothetical protein A3G24_03830 [Betaproteobacteria bacterium RIFCSPLOWO2_12_FULL_62_13]
MRKTIWWLIVIFGLGLFGLIFYYAMQKMRPAPQREPPPVVAPPVPTPPAEPQIRFPIRQEPQEKPLPVLNASDPVMKEALGGLWSDKTFEQLFHLKDFIRRVVATIDNLPRNKLALRLMPVKQVDGKFLTTGKGEGLAISPDNAARYAPYMRVAGAMDATKLVALYVRFYPLFQQAYQELGYPQGYFNDRLVEVIDHLLAAPQLQAPVKLVQPKVFYLFEDSELEARSAGQKILIRIGDENAARIKAKLREIRGELTRQVPKK